MRNGFLFLKSFLRAPFQVASVTPTSRWGTRAVLKKISAGTRKVVVEYGPGTGVFAHALLRSDRLTPACRLILIEKNHDFARHLHDTIHDPRVTVFHDDAEHIGDILAECGEEAVDYIVSSIPLSCIEREQRRRILERSRAALREDGALLVYLFRTRVLGYLREVFPVVAVCREFRNIPPLLIFEARKRALQNA